jgi:hypothetical protein
MLIQSPAPKANRATRALRVATLLIAATLLFQPMMAFAQDESDLVGEYAVGISREDLPTDVAGIYSYVGRWRIAFNPDGSYEAERTDVGVMVTGQYSVDGTRVTITDEAGLLSCSNPAATTIPIGDIATGVYEWTKIGSELRLTVQEDECEGRVQLLSTHPLGIYVACTTEPLPLSATIDDEESAGTPTAVPATPTPVEEEEDDDRSPLDILTPGATDEEEEAAADDLEENIDEIAPQIDELLSQMSACWATGNPDLWLPLLSEDFRDSLLGGAGDFRATLAAAMAAPIVWERAGDITAEGENQVSAIVRSTVGIEEDFQRFLFVFEDGEWRWDG